MEEELSSKCDMRCLSQHGVLMHPLEMNLVSHEEHEVPQSAQEGKGCILTSIGV